LRVAQSGRAALPPTSVLSILVGGLGEELGWRGYALPRVQAQLGPRAASAVVGGLWAGWRLLLFLWASPLTGGALLAEYALYAPILVETSFLLTWAYNATGGSLWPVVLLHAAATATDKTLLVPLSPRRAGTWAPYLVAALSACRAAAWIAVRPAARSDGR
jgi:membrane protease YdiL (CAAX protease family)